MEHVIKLVCLESLLVKLCAAKQQSLTGIN